ncbi:MAG: LysR family transcriptional regulator [Kofleriaceae bacterium]
MHDLDWQDLRHFAAFVKAKSLSGAAKELAVDHVTVARRLAALERAVGLRLVDRRERVPVLTEDGARLAVAVAAMERGADAVTRAAARVSDAVEGIVTITAPPTMMNALIAPRAGELRAAYPGLTLHLVGEKRVVSLSRREADLALRLVKPVEPELVVKKLGAFAFRLYGHRRYLDRTKPRDHVFITFDASGSSLPQHAWLERHAGDRAIVLRTNDLESQLAAARAGLGLVVLPAYVAASYPDLVVVPSKLRPIKRELWRVFHEDLRGVSSVRAACEFLDACTSELA